MNFEIPHIMITLDKFLLGALCSLFFTPLLAQKECGTEVSQEDHTHYKQLVKQYKNNVLEEFILSIEDIPVYYHIIRRSDGTGGANLANLDDELELVNDYFSGTLFNFFRCENPNYIDDDYYFNSIDKASDDILNLVTAHEVSGAMNIFFAPNIIGSTGNSICGFARFPWDEGNYIFMDNACATNSSTLAHEFGHYFGLYHTHNAGAGIDHENITRNPTSNCFNCEIAGDLLCDTPADPRLTSAMINEACEYIGDEMQVCMEVAPAELFAYTPHPNNIMSYSTKECRSYFSPGQENLMYGVYEDIRKAQFEPLQCALYPCPDEIVLPHSEEEIVLSPKVIHAKNNLFSAEKIETTEKPGVIYKAGNAICLQPGFSTGSQTIFEAVIEACDESFNQNELEEEEAIQESTFVNSSLSARQIEIIGLNIIPNPFQNELSLSFELLTEGKVSITAFDALGQMVSGKNPSNTFEPGYHETQINTATWNSGVYFLEVRAGNLKQVRKVVKISN